MDKSEFLIELTKHASSRHDERRKYEWRVSFAFWALIIGAIIKKGDMGFLELPGWFWAHIAAIILLIFDVLWLRGLWIANHNDKELADHFRKMAVDNFNKIEFSLEIPGKIDWSKDIRKIFYRDWAMRFHLFVTFFLLIIFCLSK